MLKGSKKHKTKVIFLKTAEYVQKWAHYPSNFNNISVNRVATLIFDSIFGGFRGDLEPEIRGFSGGF